MTVTKFTTDELLTFGRLMAQLEASNSRWMASLASGIIPAFDDSRSISTRLDSHLLNMARNGETSSVRFTYENCMAQGMSWDATMSHLFHYHCSD